MSRSHPDSIVFKFSWLEGRVERQTEMEIPVGLPWISDDDNNIVEFIRQGLKKAYQYSDIWRSETGVPEGLLRDGETVTGHVSLEELKRKTLEKSKGSQNNGTITSK